MNTIVTRLLELAEGVTNKPSGKEAPHHNVADSIPNGDLVNPKCLYDHGTITIEEDVINRILRARLRNHWLFHSVTFEFEPNNKVYLGIITTLGNVMSLLGTFFNPFIIGNDGSGFRFEKKGIIRFDLSPDSEIRRLIPFPERPANSEGPILLTNAKTQQSVLQLEYYAFHEPVETYSMKDIPVKTSWVRSIDMAAALLLPIGVWISFVILHHYLPTETIEFSFSTYFLISLGILMISFIVMNIPRYIYMYFDNRKKWQSAFVHNNIKIQMRKLHRRIFIQQAALLNDGHEMDAKGQERIRDLLLQIRDKRFLAQRLKIADEDRDRKQKVKFIIAYIGCTLLEWMLLIH